MVFGADILSWKSIEHLAIACDRLYIVGGNRANNTHPNIVRYTWSQWQTATREDTEVSIDFLGVTDSGAGQDGYFRYHAWFPNARETFLTQCDSVMNWPFSKMPVGKVTKLKLFFLRLASHFRMALFQPMSVRISANSLQDRGPNYGLYVKVGWQAIELGQKIDGVDVIIKYPLSVKAAKQLDQSVTTLRRLEKICPSNLQQYLPRILRYDPNESAVEALCPGHAATIDLWKPIFRRRVVYSCFDFILQLHQQTQNRTTLSRQHIKQLLCDDKHVVETAGKRVLPEFSLCDIYTGIQRQLENVEIPLVLSHGDYWSGNLLVESGQLSAVIDWDNSQGDDFPLFDLLHFLLHINKSSGFWSFSKNVLRLAQEKQVRLRSVLLLHYLSYMNINTEHLNSLIAAYWIRRCSLWCKIDLGEEVGTLSSHERKWITNNIVRGRDMVQKVLSLKHVTSKRGILER